MSKNHFYMAKRNASHRLRHMNGPCKATSKAGWRPARVAAASGNRAVINIRLEEGQPVDDEVIKTETSLHSAGSYGHGEVVEHLLELG